MDKKTSDYRKDIERALRSASRYNKSLGAQIESLAGALRTLALANDDIDSLESTTIAVISRYGNETLAPHPAFKIQKDAQDSVTRQMKALGLTVEELTGGDDNDPLIELTANVAKTGLQKSVTVGRKN